MKKRRPAQRLRRRANVIAKLGVMRNPGLIESMDPSSKSALAATAASSALGTETCSMGITATNKQLHG